MVDVRVTGEISLYNAAPINLRCPVCQHMGAFHPIGLNDAAWERYQKTTNGQQRYLGTGRVGTRQCPNYDCRAIIFYASNGTDRVFYPPEVIDFDATNLPDRILASLEEAVKAHAAGCYRASALMVRRVLEEVCEDKNAKGDNLMKRLSALSGTVIIPAELLSAANELRLLGNDAAHIEAKTYDQIGHEECAIAIELAKELLKAVYQYTSLVAKLQALKKPIQAT